MLSPKPHGASPSRKAADPTVRAPGERRTFAAPGPHAAGATPARWPQAWIELSSDVFIRTDAAQAIAGELDVPPDPSKRALIVIPTLNEEAAIGRVIAQLLDGDGLVDPLVVVADGGSTDATRPIVAEISARDPRVQLVDNPARLQSAGINLAASAVAGERPWLVRVDAHADYPPNYVSTLIDEAQRTGASSVVVAMDTRGDTGFQRAVAAAQNSLLGTGGAAHRLGGAARWVDHGHHALFELEAFEEVGGYDESFSHNEDAELDLRLAKQGGGIWLTDKVRIGYYPRRTPQALWKQYVGYGRGRARTVLKHYTPLKLRQALPLAVAPAVAAVPLGLLFWPLLVPALVWAAAALSFGVVLAAARRDATVLMSGPAAMIMHLAWSAGFWAQLACHPGERLLHVSLEPPRQAVS